MTDGNLESGRRIYDFDQNIKQYEKFTGPQGISSDVLVKGSRILKITHRNSTKRVLTDLEVIKKLFAEWGFSTKLVPSTVFPCLYKGREAVCIEQEKIQGPTMLEIGKTELEKHLRTHPKDLRFLNTIIIYSITKIVSNESYIDVVGRPVSDGNPEGQVVWTSTNILLDKKLGLVLCDIGLPPHEYDLGGKLRDQQEYFTSDQVVHYLQKLRGGKEWLQSLRTA